MALLPLCEHSGCLVKVGLGRGKIVRDVVTRLFVGGVEALLKRVDSLLKPGDFAPCLLKRLRCGTQVGIGGVVKPFKLYRGLRDTVRGPLAAGVH